MSNPEPEQNLSPEEIQADIDRMIREAQEQARQTAEHQRFCDWMREKGTPLPDLWENLGD